MEELLEEIFVSTGYLAALGAMENGQRRREDARRFASFCTGAGAGGISALVRAIDAATLAGSTGQETAPGGARPGCVTIMTIHRSKGLQFPVVFVADTARQFNAADTRQPVLLHRVWGAGLRLRPEGGEGAYKTAAYTALSTVHAAEMRSEQMRLLYVALTRAQDKLILTVPLGIGRTSNPFAKAAAFLAAGAGETLNAQAGSFADWLRAALLAHPNGGPLRRLAGNLELPFADTRSTITLTVQADVLPPEEVPAEAEEPPRPEADPALVETLRQGFGWRYPAAALADIPPRWVRLSMPSSSTPTSGRWPLCGTQRTLPFWMPSAPSGSVRRRRSSRPPPLPGSWMSIRYSALCAARRSAASAGQRMCCGSWLLSRRCLPPRSWLPRAAPCPTALPPTPGCWCRASRTSSSSTPTTSSFWTTRRTAARLLPISSAPTALSWSSTPRPLISASPPGG